MTHEQVTERKREREREREREGSERVRERGKEIGSAREGQRDWWCCTFRFTGADERECGRVPVLSFTRMHVDEEEADDVLACS